MIFKRTRLVALASVVLAISNDRAINKHTDFTGIGQLQRITWLSHRIECAHHLE